MASHIDRALCVIGQEELALAALRQHLRDNPEPFGAGVDFVLRMPGKVVVTGMGKAGNIGEKISATLRSTGQPSVFLDPAQAAHGDMGMIAAGDVLLALSNSGETDEVLEVIRYCNHHGLGIVAVTAAEASPIALEATHLLTYPRMPEGCPIGRAPMASAVMMLALGDAIAGALMEARGFTAADFLKLHHGGYLGRLAAVA